MKTLIHLTFVLLTLNLAAQDVNKNFDRWQISDERINISGMDLSPDEKSIAIVLQQKEKILIYDIDSKEVKQEIDFSKQFFDLGYNIKYSPNGNYLLVSMKVLEYSFKKAAEGSHYIIDLASGKTIQTFNKINDAKFTPDEKQIVTLENGTIYFRDIVTGKVNRKFSPEDACNAIAISPDGKDIAVVKRPTKAEAKMLAGKNVSKKRIKAAAKFKHLITVYDVESLELKNLIPEFYDNINLLFYNKDGSKLMSFNVATNSYVNVALPNEDYASSREAYLSRTTLQPEFAYSHNQQYFAISTVEKFPSLNVYNVETGSMLDIYDTKMRIWKNIKEGVYAGSNTSFVFLPGDKYILMGYGNSLIKWKFKKEN